MTDEHNVVRHPAQTPLVTEPIPTPPTRVHGLAIAGMAAAALLGIATTLVLVTVTMPGSITRYLVGVIVVAGLLFLTCAAAAVLTAARDTYARDPLRRDD